MELGEEQSLIHLNVVVEEVGWLEAERSSQLVSVAIQSLGYNKV